MHNSKKNVTGHKYQASYRKKNAIIFIIHPVTYSFFFFISFQGIKYIERK